MTKFIEVTRQRTNTKVHIHFEDVAQMEFVPTYNATKVIFYGGRYQLWVLETPDQMIELSNV